MDNFNDVANGINLKKTLFGGFNKESVYVEMKKITYLYHSKLEEAENKNIQTEKLIDALKSDLEQVKKDNTILKALLQEEMKNKSAYNDQMVLLADAIKAVRENEEKTIKESQNKAYQIVDNAHKEADVIYQKCMEVKSQAEKENQFFMETKRNVVVLLQNLHSDATRIASEIENYQKYVAEVEVEESSENIQMTISQFVDDGSNNVKNIPNDF